jgi:hypothetical protein
LGPYGGRLAIEATMEPPVTMGRNQEARIPDGRRNGPSQSTAENGGETSPQVSSMVLTHLFDAAGA